MNDLAVVELQGSEAELLAKIKPTYYRKYDSDKHNFVYSRDEKLCESYVLGAEKVKEGIKDLYAVGKDFKRNVAKFSLALKNIYDHVADIEDFSPQAYTFLYDGESYVSRFFQNDGFGYIVSVLGISKSTAYRYKDLATFVDTYTGDFYKCYKDYSVSLLTEISIFKNYLIAHGRSDIYRFYSIIPATITVDDMREYRRLVDLYERNQKPFNDNEFMRGFSHSFYELTATEVLEHYREWQQKQATKELEDKLSVASASGTVDISTMGVQQSVSEAPSAKAVIAQSRTLGEAADMQQQLLELEAEVVQLKSELYLLKPKVVEELNECGDCRYNGVKPQKCQCCRRNGKLKDLFEERD